MRAGGRLVGSHLDNQDEKRILPPDDQEEPWCLCRVTSFKGHSGYADPEDAGARALQPMHGYGITVRLEQVSNGVFRVNAGSLFESEWKAT
jgi:hypothetical protein